MKQSASLFVWIIPIFLLFACGKENKVPSNGELGKEIKLSYAKNLSLTAYKEYTVATLRNPWDTLKTLHTYVLVDKEKPLPINLPKGTVIRIPLENTLVYTSVHCSLLDQIGALEQIGGICELKYIKLEAIQERCRDKRMVDVGNGMAPDIEKIIDLHPDAILLSPFENSGYGRVEKLNIPLIECADYMETSPLGRVEWVRFYGILYGKTVQADSLFAKVESEYYALKDLTESIPAEKKPLVVSDLKDGSTWYIPGGQSSVAQLYADAGATYVFAEDGHSGSVPLAFESVFDRGVDADFWLIKYNQPNDKTYSELKRDYIPYAGFRAFKERQIYGCNTSRIPYYEDSPFHPERILKDLIRIFHPTLLPGYDLFYYTNLSE